MPPRTKNIVVSFMGECVKVNYWAGGNGRKVNGCLTSYRQLQSGLRRYYHVWSLNLYTLVNRKMVRITSDARLKQALMTALPGGYLFVYAFGREELYRTAKLPEYTLFVPANQVEQRPAKRTKRLDEINARTARQQRLERKFPA